MASKHRHRPSLAAIPIPPNDLPKAYFQSPRTAVPKAAPLAASARKPPEEELSSIDPDDLFVRHTISEIRGIQAKLRAEADAKQEELRLMVGERYRDLLQASTSIVSISDSSARVMSALAEMRKAMVPDEPQRKARSSSLRGKDDAHLKTLQSLSAHLKLLLDAPEHLWRLLERKQYLQAAWLFLLARVVHRALVTDDPEERDWESEGISILTQFPLVQRQWDTVAPFRSQIAHRATQYLREHSLSSESACSTILTLHLLDSLPLTETLSTLLSQRSRTLNALLARNLDFRSSSRPGSPIFKSRRKNREVAGMLLSPPSATAPQRTRNRRDVIKDVRGAVAELLDVICGTMNIAREMFRERSDGGKSLVERSLGDIQSDSPPDTVLTTSSLLSTLPSSTHLLMLPPTILSYKPYIDLTSPSAHVDPAVLDTRLSSWFDKAMEGFEGRVHAWFEGLESIREVWGVRREVLERLQTMEQQEKVKVRRILDGGLKDRVGEIAKAALEDVEESLESALRRTVQDVRDGVEECGLDITPSTFLFSAPPLPFIGQMSTNSGAAGSSFKRFKDALRQRADGRTPLLDRVLSDIESKAREIEEDLEFMSKSGGDSPALQDEIMSIHYPAAQASSTRIVQILDKLIAQEMSDDEQISDQSMDLIVFLGRISHAISLSAFVQSLRAGDEALQDFRKALTNLHDHSLTRFRSHAVSKALIEYSSMLAPSRHIPASIEFTWPSQPSPQLINSLLSLISSLERLGLSRAELSSKEVTSMTLRDFQSAVASEVPMKGHVWRRDQAQLFWDLTFLWRLPRSRHVDIEDSIEAGDVLAPKLSLIRSQLRSSALEETWSKFDSHIDLTIDQYLPRSQTLLAPLLGTVLSQEKSLTNGNGVEHHISSVKQKSTALLPFGTPAAEQDFKPAIEVVKPSARFGLLLVGSTAVR